VKGVFYGPIGAGGGRFSFGWGRQSGFDLRELALDGHDPAGNL
jgi:hypothetical protein